MRRTLAKYAPAISSWDFAFSYDLQSTDLFIFLFYLPCPLTLHVTPAFQSEQAKYPAGGRGLILTIQGLVASAFAGASSEGFCTPSERRRCDKSPSAALGLPRAGGRRILS